MSGCASRATLATIGISNHAQEQLGDVVFVELPALGKQVARNDALAVVESVKAASDVYAPVGGEVVEVNAALNDEPALVNSGAESDGWFCKLRLGDPGELEQLMDAEGYRAFVAERGLSRRPLGRSSMSEPAVPSLTELEAGTNSSAATSARTRPRSRRCSRSWAPPRSTT